MEPSTIGVSMMMRAPPTFSAASRVIWLPPAAMPGSAGAPDDVDEAVGLAFSWCDSAAWRACSAFIDGVATKYCHTNSTAAASAMAKRTFLLLFMDWGAAWKKEQDQSPTNRRPGRWDGRVPAAGQ